MSRRSPGLRNQLKEMQEKFDHERQILLQQIQELAPCADVPKPTTSYKDTVSDKEWPALPSANATEQHSGLL